MDRANLDPEVESFRRRNERVAAYTDVRKLLESKDIRSRIIHVHDLHDPKYPYPLMVDLLIKANWAGWALGAGRTRRHGSRSCRGANRATAGMGGHDREGPRARIGMTSGRCAPSRSALAGAWAMEPGFARFVRRASDEAPSHGRGGYPPITLTRTRFGRRPSNSP